jgi:hypothetical protein
MIGTVHQDTAVRNYVDAIRLAIIRWGLSEFPKVPAPPLYFRRWPFESMGADWSVPVECESQFFI